MQSFLITFFVYNHLFVHSYIVTRISILNKLFSNRYIWPIDETQTSQSGPRSNGDEEVFCSTQSSRIGDSPLDVVLCHTQDTPLVSYSTAEDAITWLLKFLSDTNNFQTDLFDTNMRLKQVQVDLGVMVI